MNFNNTEIFILHCPIFSPKCGGCIYWSSLYLTNKVALERTEAYLEREDESSIQEYLEVILLFSTLKMYYLCLIRLELNVSNSQFKATVQVWIPTMNSFSFAGWVKSEECGILCSIFSSTSECTFCQIS